MYRWSAAAEAVVSLAAGLLVLRLLLSFRQILGLVARLWRAAEDRLHTYQTYRIPMYTESLQENPLYRKAITFIDSLPSLEDSADALLFSSPYSKKAATGAMAGVGGGGGGGGASDIYLQLAPDQTVQDTFLGARVSWTNRSHDAALVLRVRKQDRRRVLRPYLQHIEAVADEIELRRLEVRLFINTVEGGGGVGEEAAQKRRRWRAVPFTHPSSMDTLAMDPDLKARVKADLEAFLKNKNYYHRLGRVWKRSYLLYGPPGTGKSSFVAAMAKFLCYDIYDLDLSRVTDGSDLKSLLLQTSPRSVILVEDLDRYLLSGTSTSTSSSSGGCGDLCHHSSSSAVSAKSLSGVLNFMDGVFSCCGEERVMVFTMREAPAAGGIDPAVVRAGRLDVHLYFPLCDFTAFKAMANSYLGLKDHKLYPAVEEIFQNGASISPAEIGEIMIAHRGSPSRALKTVITVLQQSTAGAGAAARRVGLVLGGLGGGGGGGHRRGSASNGSSMDESAFRSGLGEGGWDEDRSGGLGDGPASGGVLGSNGALNKEFRKLYGLIRRGGSRKEETPALPTPPTPPLPPPPPPRQRSSSSSSSSDLQLLALQAENQSKEHSSA